MRKHPIEWLADLKHEQRSVGEMLQIAAIHKALGIAPLSLHGRMIISAWKIQDSNYNHEFLINNDSYILKEQTLLTTLSKLKSRILSRYLPSS
jgi:hypothetical protein